MIGICVRWGFKDMSEHFYEVVSGPSAKNELYTPVVGSAGIGLTSAARTDRWNQPTGYSILNFVMPSMHRARLVGWWQFPTAAAQLSISYSLCVK